MVKRKIIEIDEGKCNGCGNCIPNCPEGALQMIDGKARVISDLFCDGLGACIGHCPVDAIKIVERDAEPYDERRVMENIVKQGDNTTVAHLQHLQDHKEFGYLKEAKGFLKEIGKDDLVNKISKPMQAPCACPGQAMKDFRDVKESSGKDVGGGGASALRQWPVQLTLVHPNAPYFQDADLLISADCVPFAYPDFHRSLLRDRIVMVGCPKLDDIRAYAEKLTDIIKSNDIRSITVAIMEVPCCSGMSAAVEKAVADSGKDIPVETKVVSITGDI